MGIYLGDLSIEQIERRLGVEFTKEDKEQLERTHQGAVNNTPLEVGKWHCFDLPFMFMTHDRETAEQFLNFFQRYDASKFKETFQIGWEA